MIIRVKKPHIIIIANHANFSFQIRAIRAIRVLLKNSQIRDKKSVPGWLFCEAFFFLSKYANAAHAIPIKERQTDFQQSRLNTKGHSYGIVPP